MASGREHNPSQAAASIAILKSFKYLSICFCVDWLGVHWQGPAPWMTDTADPVVSQGADRESWAQKMQVAARL
jgi:hypothetical protein